MAYYCRKCKKTHAGGDIARRHRIYAKKVTKKPRAKVKPRAKAPVKRKTVRAMPRKSKAPKWADFLHGFTGTEQYYVHWTKAIRWTDGIKYVLDQAGAYWLMDIVASYQGRKRLKQAPFQLWKIKVNEDKTAVVTCREDKGKRPIVRQEIPYTDFPLDEFEFYCIDRICLLKSEYQGDEEMVDDILFGRKPKAGKKKDLSYGIDVRGDRAYFIEEKHVIGAWKVDKKASTGKKESVFFRLLRKGEQLPSHGWLADDEIVQWG